MDIESNKPFKNSTGHQFDQWRDANKDKKPRQNDVVWWIWNAWSSLSKMPGGDVVFYQLRLIETFQVNRTMAFCQLRFLKQFDDGGRIV
jgi:hypothetical protein